MSKLLIDKEKIENWIKYIKKFPLYPEDEKELQSILQQGEEYNENEAIEWNEIMRNWGKIDSEARKNNNPKNSYDVIYWLREHYVAYKRKTI